MSTYGTRAASELDTVVEAVGLGSHIAKVQSLFAELVRGWAHHPVENGPLWPSDLTDDHTPYEFSLAFRHDRTEVRMLVEAQVPGGSAHDQWLAGLKLQRELASTLGFDEALFDAIRPLFAPTVDSDARFALWHSAVFEPGGKHLLKAYLNPAVDGDAGAMGRVRSALTTLGYEHALASLEQVGDGHAPHYLSLDLTNDRPRVKIYLAHRARTARSYVDHLARISVGAATDAARLLEPFIASNRELDDRPVLMCLGLRRDGSEPEVTTHFPVRCYVASDEESLAAIGPCLSPRAMKQLVELVERFARAPLGVSKGRVSYVSCGRSSDGLRHTVYLAPCCHDASPPLRLAKR